MKSGLVVFKIRCQIHSVRLQNFLSLNIDKKVCAFLVVLSGQIAIVMIKGSKTRDCINSRQLFFFSATSKSGSHGFILSRHFGHSDFFLFTIIYYTFVNVVIDT